MFGISIECTKCPWSSSLGIARALLALGTLLTLLFNDTNSLFFDLISKTDGGKIALFYYKYSLFVVLKEHLALTKTLSIIFLVIVIGGWRSRWTCLIHWYITFSFFISGSTVDGGDQISAILTLLLIPVCLTDSRKNHYTTSTEVTTNFYFTEIAKVSLFFIGVQMSILYFDAAISKFQVEDWVNGSIVWYWFQDPVYGVNQLFEVLLLIILSNPYLILLISWGTLFIEILLGMGILASSLVKYRLFLLGAIFHFLIYLVHGLGSFYFAMMGGLTLYLINVNLHFSNVRTNFLKKN